MILFIYYVVLAFESVDDTLWCDHLNETTLAELSRSTCTIFFYCLFQTENLEILLNFDFGHFWE